MKMSRFVALVTVGCLLVVGSLTSSVFAAEQKIAFVSIQSVLFSSKEGKVAQNIIKEKQQELQKKLQVEESKREALQKEIEKKQSVWSPEVLKNKQRTVGIMQRDLKMKTDDANYEINGLMKQHVTPIEKKLNVILNSYGKEHGYTMIINYDVASRSGMIVYGNQDVDITEELVTLLDAGK